MTRGAAAPVPVRVSGGRRGIRGERRSDSVPATRGRRTPHPRPAGETFRLLSPDVAYLKLSSVQAARRPTTSSRPPGPRG